jgi:hypothetical protein
MAESNPRPLLAWLDVLERIEESLAQSLRLAPEPITRRAPVRAGHEADPLGKLDERLALWQTRLDQAQSAAASSDEELVADQETLMDWREQAGQARKRLVEWLGRATG